MKPFLLPLVALAALWMTGPLPEAQAQNTPPVANTDFATIEVGKLLRLDVLANDTDADGDTLQVIALTRPPQKGDAAIVDTAETSQRILYRSFFNVSGRDSLSYRISDGNGGTSDATVRITLIANNPPVAVDDSAAVFNTAVVEIEVLANDTDPEGDTLRVVNLPRLPEHGTATLVGDEDERRIRYDPDDDYTGLDSLLYAIEDAGGNTDTATVRITVLFNQRPTAFNDSLTTFINEAAEIDVRDNDTDEEDDSLFILTIPDPPNNGNAEIINGGRAIRYTPRTGYLGNDQFDYTLTDGVERNGSLIADRATVFVQVLPPGEDFSASLAGANMTPPIQTRASGLLTATLNGNQIAFSGFFGQLKSPILEDNGALVRVGPAGRTGSLAFALTPTPGSGRRSGVFLPENNTFTLTDEQTDALFSRRLHVILQTEGQPEGETRGQLLPSGASAYFRAVFSGRAVAPFTASTARGSVVAERFGNTLTITGAFEELESAFFSTTGARLHRGSTGVNGDVLFDLDVDLDADRRGGVFSQRSNQIILTNDQIQLLDNGLTYIDIGSQDAQDGEIRGQLLPLTTQVFETTLSGGNEAPPVATNGTGGVLVTFDASTLALSGTLSGLSSGVDLTIRNGAHLHQAPPGENGPIVFELAPVLVPDRQEGFFPTGANTFSIDPAIQTALFDGLFYVNVHTEGNPSGEVRGTLLPSPNLAPPASAMITPADGAMVDLSVDPNTALTLAWDAADDANANTVYYGWQLAQDAGFQTLIYAANLTPETTLATTTGTLDTALANAGINPNATIMLYHRVVTTDGSLATVGPTAQVTVIRGFATDVEEAAVPEQFAVLGNYPNPFNPATTVRVDLPQAARVQVAVYDVLGRRVLTTPAQDLAAGTARAVSVDARALASGLYLYRVIAHAATETFVGTGRMTVVR